MGNMKKGSPQPAADSKANYEDADNHRQKWKRAYEVDFRKMARSGRVCVILSSADIINNQFSWIRILHITLYVTV